MDKVCCFYASGEHLMSILLPYINEKLEENQNIVTILEEDIGKSAQALRKIFNFTNENWIKIDEILKRRENVFKENNFEDSIVIIVGKNSFLEEEKKEIRKAKIVICCYELMQGLDKVENILEESEKILTTKGLKETSEMFTRIPKKSYKEITILK